MSTSPPRILVSNDDGYLAEGLVALAEAMAPLGEVWVVAPDREQSATSHALSLHRPLRIKRVRQRWYAVDGTPSDCSYLAIHHILQEHKPALMVSGINHGANLADDITYSGTVAAAMEASLLGVPAIAFSLVAREAFEFGPAVRIARAIAKTALENPRPRGMLLNVNIPKGEPRGYAVTRQGHHPYDWRVVENIDPRGRKYYWIGGTRQQVQQVPGSDSHAVECENLVSITPLHLDLTQYSQLDELGRWRVEGLEKFER